MSKNTDNEMARIQRGLEEFLEQEMASGNEGRKKSNSRREPQLYDLEEDWDSKENLKTRKQTGRANSGARQTGKTQYYKEKPEKKQNRKVQSGRKSAKKSEPNGDKKVKNDKKKKSAGKRLKRFLVVVVLIIALLGAGLYSFAGSLY